MISYEVMRALLELFPEPIAFDNDNSTSVSFQFVKFLLENLQFCLPLVAIGIFLLELVIFSPEYKADTLLLREFLVISFIMEIYWIIAELAHKSLPYSWHNDVLFWYITSNIVVIPWITVINLLIVKTVNYNVRYGSSKFYERLFGVVILLIVYLLYFLLNIANRERSGKIVLSVCFYIVLIACYSLGFGFIGGAVLRIAGLGGGTSLVYRVGHGSPVKGCLVWPSSNYFIIRPCFKSHEAGSRLRFG